MKFSKFYVKKWKKGRISLAKKKFKEEKEFFFDIILKGMQKTHNSLKWQNNNYKMLENLISSTTMFINNSRFLLRDSLSQFFITACIQALSSRHFPCFRRITITFFNSIRLNRRNREILHSVNKQIRAKIWQIIKHRLRWKKQIMKLKNLKNKGWKQKITLRIFKIVFAK